RRAVPSTGREGIPYDSTRSADWGAPGIPPQLQADDTKELASPTIGRIFQAGQGPYAISDPADCEVGRERCRRDRRQSRAWFGYREPGGTAYVRPEFPRHCRYRS